MASNTNFHFAVPTTTERAVAIFQVYPKTSKINILLHNNGQKVARAGEGGMKEGTNVNLHIWESNDRKNWKKLTVAAKGSQTASAPISISPGGHADFGILSAKKYLMITGFGDTSGGYVRADFQFRGDPYFGQMDVEMLGKSGYGYDLGMIKPVLYSSSSTLWEKGVEASEWVDSAPTSVNYATADSPRGAGIGSYDAPVWPSLE